jgi:hypothetical protein
LLLVDEARRETSLIKFDKVNWCTFKSCLILWTFSYDFGKILEISALKSALYLNVFSSFLVSTAYSPVLPANLTLSVSALVPFSKAGATSPLSGSFFLAAS